ncbi:hypothetical protein A0128_02340 [Leptospira tipperaryensis]|uniref:Uncharacterized protein n=1 Tax=Leptospira tipperaryensis TaxID=2564040 RepID=A0A1D7UT67_9LEPT|nr:hypothetical protein A0128_02340 [Leptospira tipperaryensis]
MFNGNSAGKKSKSGDFPSRPFLVGISSKTLLPRRNNDFKEKPDSPENKMDPQEILKMRKQRCEPF